jgi:hypothetical protein
LFEPVPLQHERDARAYIVLWYLLTGLV